VKRRYALLVLCALVALAVLWWRGQKPQTVKRSRMIMGTVVEVTASGRDGLMLHEQIEAAFSEMERLERLLSPHIETSEVAQLATSRDLQVSDETRTVIAIGLEVAQKSDGAFDMSLGRLVEAWDVTAVQPRLPSADEIREALKGIGPEAIRLDGNRVIKREASLQPEFGGVAKGYAVEAGAKLLRKAAIDAGAVNAGGDMALVGRPEQREWRIGIRHPREADQLLGTLVVPGGAVATSGDYERFFEQNGERFHHLFDPRNGYPARGCQSVTVWTTNAAYADALATAAFVLGPTAGLELLENWPQTEALLVAADGTIFMTGGMEERIEWP